MLADSKEDLQELELGFTDQALSQFWEKVDEASQESEAWLQQQAADKTRQQQREEEERVIPEPAHDTCHMTRAILGTSRLVPSRCSTAADRCFRMFVRAQSRRPRTRLQRAAERRRVVVGVPGKLNAYHPHDSCGGARVRLYCAVRDICTMALSCWVTTAGLLAVALCTDGSRPLSFYIASASSGGCLCLLVNMSVMTHRLSGVG